jgi:rhodanese-related sulfurtransferase
MSEQVKMVDVETVQDWIEADKVVIVDVREQNEYLAHHIAGATLLPLSVFDPKALPPVPEGKKLLLHCRSANRCGTASEILVASGYKGEINRLAGGINAWIAAGAPVE